MRLFCLNMNIVCRPTCAFTFAGTEKVNKEFVKHVCVVARRTFQFLSVRLQFHCSTGFTAKMIKMGPTVEKYYFEKSFIYLCKYLFIYLLICLFSYL